MSDPQKIAGRYALTKRMGAGITGATFKAQDELLERMVAIKVAQINSAETLSDSEDAHKLVYTLINEARMLGRLQHPNILPIYDLVQENEYLYLIMPVLRYVRWRDEAREQALGDMLRILDRIADALDFLHRKKMIHNNLKAKNIMLSEDNQPYIVDFAYTQDMDAEGFVLGSIPYLAPEMVLGERSTSATDIFLFGILVYEMLTGQYPFPLNSVAVLFKAILTELVPSIQEWRPELAPVIIQGIDAVIANLTAKNPNDRYKTTTEAVKALYRVIDSGQQIIEGKLFISYARKDEKFVYELADELQRYSVDIWIDRNIEYGSEWDESIDQQLASCDAILVIATSAAMASHYVTYEWSYFIGSNKAVLPFVPHTEVNQVQLHPRLSRVQYIAGTEDMSQNVRQIIQIMSQVIASRKKQAP